MFPLYVSEFSSHITRIIELKYLKRNCPAVCSEPQMGAVRVREQTCGLGRGSTQTRGLSCTSKCRENPNNDDTSSTLLHPQSIASSPRVQLLCTPLPTTSSYTLIIKSSIHLHMSKEESQGLERGSSAG